MLVKVKAMLWLLSSIGMLTACVMSLGVGQEVLAALTGLSAVASAVAFMGEVRRVR